jgi:hypothetical protein
MYFPYHVLTITQLPLIQTPQSNPNSFNMKASTAILLVSALPSVFAWGDLGHETIAYIAQNFGQYPALPRSCVTNIE